MFFWPAKSGKVLNNMFVWQLMRCALFARICLFFWKCKKERKREIESE